MNSQSGGLNVKYKFGPYPNGSAIKEGLKIIRKIFPFRDKCVPYEYLPSNKVTKARPCFNKQIGLCPGFARVKYQEKNMEKSFSILNFSGGKEKSAYKKT